MIGGVWAYYISFIYPQFAVDPLITIGAVLMVFLGGKGTLWGPALGAFILVPAQQYLAYRLGASQLYLVGYALGVPGRHAAAPPRDPPVASSDRLARRRSGPSAAMRRRRSPRPARSRWRHDARCSRSRALRKRFGGVIAVDGCSLRSAEGTVTGADRPERLRQDDACSTW